MSQSMVVDVQHNPFMDGAGPFRVICDWVSAADGTVSLGIRSTYNTAKALKTPTPPAPSRIRGLLRSCQTIPGLLGDKATDLPDAYDLTILDPYGDDILGGNGTARSATVSDILIFQYG